MDDLFERDVVFYDVSITGLREGNQRSSLLTRINWLINFIWAQYESTRALMKPKMQQP